MRVIEVDTLDESLQDKIVIDQECPECNSKMVECGLTDYRAFWKCSRCDVEYNCE